MFSWEAVIWHPQRNVTSKTHIWAWSQHQQKTFENADLDAVGEHVDDALVAEDSAALVGNDECMQLVQASFYRPILMRRYGFRKVFQSVPLNLNDNIQLI